MSVPVVCVLCGRTLGAEEVVYRVERCGWVPGRRVIEVCVGCAWEEPWRSEAPCEHCGRPVVDLSYGATVVACSPRCRKRANKRRYRERRRAQRWERRTWNGGGWDVVDLRPSCLCCDEVFMPSRSDATYCSGACRQKAYRRRKALV